MTTLFNVETGFKELPILTRILSSIIVMAESKEEALRLAQRHYPEVLAQGTEHRVIEVEHVVVNWPSGEVAVIEKKNSRQFHC
jgi:hypothetical protein